MNINSSTFRIAIDDGVDDSDNVFYFEHAPCSMVGGPIDPDYQPCGDTLSWKRKVPETHYLIRVRTNDGGETPHFHVVDANTEGEKFSSCICIDKSEYFKHGKHRDVLNSSDRAALNSFLQMTPRNETRTNWHRVVDEWNRNNSKRKISDSMQMPDYHQIIG